MSQKLADPMRSVPSFACVVLGAGAGTRFGAPKASAQIPDGPTFVEQVVGTARACGANPVVVVTSPGRRAPAGAVGIVNPDPFSPQIRSVRLGLAQLANTSVNGTLVWPVDCPLVQPATVSAIVAVGTAGAKIAVPNHAGRNGHPTWFARDVWPELMVAEADGARSVIRRDEGRVARVAVADSGVLTDIDTREDLERAVQEREARPA